MLTVLLTPFSMAAVFAAITAQYNGLKPSPGAAYRVTLNRWLSILGVVAILFLTVAAYVIVVVLAVLFVTFVIVLPLIRAHAVPVGGGLLIDFGAAAIALVPLAWASLAYYFAIADVIAAGSSTLDAVGSSFRRVLGRGNRLRSLALALITLAISLATSIISLFVTMFLFNLSHNAALIDAASTFLRLLGNLVTLTFVAVAYFDSRVRLEQFNLEPAPA